MMVIQITGKTTPKELQIASPNILSKILGEVDKEIPGFRDLAESKYFQRKLITYEDLDGKTKLAFSLVFVQDLNKPIENLDSLVFTAVKKSLDKMKLTMVVNDVVVNLIHSRDGIVSA